MFSHLPAHQRRTKLTLGIVTLLILLTLVMDIVLDGRILKTLNTSLFAAGWLVLFLIYPNRLGGIVRFLPLVLIIAGVALLFYRIKEGSL